MQNNWLQFGALSMNFDIGSGLTPKSNWIMLKESGIAKNGKYFG